MDSVGYAIVLVHEAQSAIKAGCQISLQFRAVFNRSDLLAMQLQLLFDFQCVIQDYNLTIFKGDCILFSLRCYVCYLCSQLLRYPL